MDFTRPDVYRSKSLITRQRRQAQYHAARELQAQLNAYMVACRDARKSGKPLPQLSDYTGAQSHGL